MKKLFYYSIIVLACFAVNNKIFAQNANTTLSNLTSPTKVNVNLVPGNNNKRNLGSATIGWKNLYLDSAVYLNGKKFLAATNYNTAVGTYTLISNTSGYENTATGSFALQYNTSGHHNAAIGEETLSNNTTGSANAATGIEALYTNTTGDGNTADGYYTLFSNTTGNYNTASGFVALSHNNENYNTAFGAYTLYRTTASRYNTAVGYNAGGNFDNGWNNVFLGGNTDVNGDGYYNVIAIGQGTVCTDVSQVTIGNGSTATYRAYANWTNISDGRFKKNIKENVPGLEFINKLQPITYTLDATGIDNFLHKDLPQDKQANDKAKAVMNKAFADKGKVVYTGFIAQDVEKAAKSLNYDFSGVDAAKNNKDLYGLRYAEFVVPLVKAVQELSKMNDDKDAKINDLKNQINELKAMIISGKQSAVSGEQSAAISSALLQQNTPNPFTNSTTINYMLPQKFASAQIVITDKNGNTLKAVNVSGSGKGTLKVDASTFAGGAYQYSLILDGKLIATKQMEHLK
jgi:hypothetical protein